MQKDMPDSWAGMLQKMYILLKLREIGDLGHFYSKKILRTFVDSYVGPRIRAEVDLPGTSNFLL
jgi:hypothetical protein